MPTNQKTLLHSLNLSPRYAPEWGVWEVVREIICNAMDAVGADGLGTKYTIVGISEPDTLSVWTETSPTLADLFVIGQGTKQKGGETIGQFGEGLKMAALVATRLGTITMQLPGYDVEFLMKEVMGSEVLHAKVIPTEEAREGFTIRVQAPGVHSAADGRFLQGTASGPVDKADPEHIRIFSKGVYITQKPGRSLWDWNLKNLTINRDRSVVSNFDLSWEVNSWLQNTASTEQLLKVMLSDGTWEASICGEYTVNSEFGSKLAAIFTGHFGDMAVLSIDSDIDDGSKAQVEGFKVITSVPEQVQRAMAGYVQTAAQAVRPTMKPERVAIEANQYALELAELRMLDDIIGAPDVKVCIFQNFDEATLGAADLQELTLWLNESLFTQDNRQLRVRTYLHEVAHFMAFANDATVKFENALDAIAGRLALLYLDGPAKS